jgi:U3 small nucleolar RNA-associated protein 22
LNLDACYHSTSNDPRLTILVLCPRKGKVPHYKPPPSFAEDVCQGNSQTNLSKLNVHIRIMPTLPSISPIPHHRLSPSHANFRTHTPSDKTKVNQTASTPLYNTALLTSFVPKSNLLTTHALKQDVPAFSDALGLLRVWANQRGYGNGARLFVRGFEGKGPWWSAVLRLLLVGGDHGGKQMNRKPLGRGLSSYQLFKAALDFLGVCMRSWEYEARSNLFALSYS